jgi:hypothetical protein
MGANTAEANYYKLERKGVRITYQLTKSTQGEQVHYVRTRPWPAYLSDVQRDLTFKGVEG